MTPLRRAIAAWRRLPRVAQRELVAVLRDRALMNTAWARNPLYDGEPKYRRKMLREARALRAAAAVMEAAVPRKVRRR